MQNVHSLKKLKTSVLDDSPKDLKDVNKDDNFTPFPNEI